jgi:hypothetical protein
VQERKGVSSDMSFTVSGNMNTAQRNQVASEAAIAVKTSVEDKLKAHADYGKMKNVKVETGSPYFETVRRRLGGRRKFEEERELRRAREMEKKNIEVAKGAKDHDGGVKSNDPPSFIQKSKSDVSDPEHSNHSDAVVADEFGVSVARRRLLQLEADSKRRVDDSSLVSSVEVEQHGEVSASAERELRIMNEQHRRLSEGDGNEGQSKRHENDEPEVRSEAERNYSKETIVRRSKTTHSQSLREKSETTYRSLLSTARSLSTSTIKIVVPFTIQSDGGGSGTLNFKISAPIQNSKYTLI